MLLNVVENVFFPQVLFNFFRPLKQRTYVRFCPLNPQSCKSSADSNAATARTARAAAMACRWPKEEWVSSIVSFAELETDGVQK